MVVRKSENVDEGVLESEKVGNRGINVIVW